MQSASITNFEDLVLNNPRPVLVDFGSPWCAPCRELEPVLQELQQEHLGLLDVVTVDATEHADLASQYGVMSLPTLLVFVQGEVQERLTLERSKQDICSRLKRFL